MKKNTMITINALGTIVSAAGMIVYEKLNKKKTAKAKAVKPAKTVKAVEFRTIDKPIKPEVVINITTSKKVSVHNLDETINMDMLDEFRSINEQKNDKLNKLEELYSEKESMESKGIISAIEKYAKGETQIMYNAYLFCYSQMNQLKKRISEYNEILEKIQMTAAELDKINKELEKYEF